MNSYIKTPDILDALESGSATRDQVLEALNIRAAMKAAMREVDARFEDAVVAWIKEHGPLQDGEVRYYVGPEKKTPSTDQDGAVIALLEIGGPPLLCQCLSSNALKHGAC